jgi:hypothetical protein
LDISVSYPLLKQHCSQQQPYLSMDISVSFLLLNVAPSDSLNCPWTFRCPSLSACEHRIVLWLIPS